MLSSQSSSSSSVMFLDALCCCCDAVLFSSGVSSFKGSRKVKRTDLKSGNNSIPALWPGSFCFLMHNWLYLNTISLSRRTAHHIPKRVATIKKLGQLNKLSQSGVASLWFKGGQGRVCSRQMISDPLLRSVCNPVRCRVYFNVGEEQEIATTADCPAWLSHHGMILYSDGIVFLRELSLCFRVESTTYNWKERAFQDCLQ